MKATYFKELFWCDFDVTHALKGENEEIIIGTALPDDYASHPRNTAYIGVHFSDEVRSEFLRGELCMRQAMLHPSTDLYRYERTSETVKHSPEVFTLTPFSDPDEDMLPSHSFMAEDFHLASAWQGDRDI